MQEFERLGGELSLCEVGIDELERSARTHDLVIVASGKGEIGSLFELDRARSPFSSPQRALALAYVRGHAPAGALLRHFFSLIPGVGEYFVFPALTTNGPCEIMVFEGLLGGPMDCWVGEQDTPDQHLEKCQKLLSRFVPGGKCALPRGRAHRRQTQFSRGDSFHTCDARSRRFPRERAVLGMGDALGAQRSRHRARLEQRSKMRGKLYLESILARRDGGAVDNSMDGADLRALLAGLCAVGRPSGRTRSSAGPGPHVLRLLGSCRRGSARASPAPSPTASTTRAPSTVVVRCG